MHTLVVLTGAVFGTQADAPRARHVCCRRRNIVVASVPLAAVPTAFSVMENMTVHNVAFGDLDVGCVAASSKKKTKKKKALEKGKK